jgi:hypothetical protein
MSWEVGKSRIRGWREYELGSWEEQDTGMEGVLDGCV